MRRWLRHSALVRYLVVNMKVLDRLYVLKQRVSKTRRFEANIDAGLIQSYIDNGAIEEALAYLLGTLRLVTEEAPLLFVIDGNRRAIYRGDDPRNTHSYRLNQVLREQTSKYNFPLIDLTDRFEKDWKREGKRFDWATDGHWNQRGHWITAEAIRAFITAHQQGYFCNE